MMKAGVMVSIQQVVTHKVIGKRLSADIEFK